jgi:hypothetical protein
MVTKGLIIASPHIERILSGEKDWEMRSTSTKQRGRIALIRKGSGLVVGSVEVVGCTEKLSRHQMLNEQHRHRISSGDIESGKVDSWNRGWMLRDARLLATPIPYDHPHGAVIWVTLDETVQEQLLAAGHYPL